MKNLMILMVFTITPFTLYSKPLKSLIPKVSGKASCANFSGKLTGECQEKEGNETQTYQSALRVSQNDCESLELFDAEGGYDTYETYRIGRSNVTNQGENGTFVNATSFVNWFDSGTKLNIEQYSSAEFSFDGERKTASGKKQIQIKLMDSATVILTENFSSTTKSESGSGTYETNVECLYKLTHQKMP